MTQKTKKPVLAGTGSEVIFSGQLNTPEHTHPSEFVHRVVQAKRLCHRFGLPPIRAALIASHAFNGGVHG